MKLTAISTTGTKGSHTASDVIFAGSVNDQLLAQAIRVYMANDHQSTSRVKTRAEIVRTKKKWFKQKGTGNARHAARSAPIFVGGGVAHGPKGLSTASLSLSQKQKHQALRSAFSLQTEAIIVSDGIEALDGKTAKAQKALQTILGDQARTLVILSNRNEKSERAMANIPYALVMTAEHVTAYDICAADKIIISPEAVTALEERIGGKKAKKSEKKAVKAETKAAAVKTEATPVKKAPVKKTAAKPAAKKTVKKTTKKSTTASKAKK